MTSGSHRWPFLSLPMGAHSVVAAYSHIIFFYNTVDLSFKLISRPFILLHVTCLNHQLTELI
ncbi:hypothetical protein CS533_12670 [Yersinia bercovieri]|uniref:Uncharacterized protein n=2 Tax=Yersinia bercovieri TaxID=634 RepID=A0A2G4U1A9_YERBE|nr:hypothetical protein CS533_12670 [Yersinia bercovieri]